MDGWMGGWELNQQFPNICLVGASCHVSEAYELLAVSRHFSSKPLRTAKGPKRSNYPLFHNKCKVQRKVPPKKINKQKKNCVYSSPLPHESHYDYQIYLVTLWRETVYKEVKTTVTPHQPAATVKCYECIDASVII